MSEQNAWSPRMVASDIDGTFLTSTERVTPRLAAVLRSMQAQGVPLTLATGRPPRWLAPVLAQIPQRPVCVCSNGAIIYDSAAEEIIRSHTLSPEVQNQLVRRVTAAVETRMDELNTEVAAPSQPGTPVVGFGVERIGASITSQGDQFFVEPNFGHVWDVAEHTTVCLEELVGAPAVKFFIRSTVMDSAALYDLCAPHIDELAQVTYSYHGGLLEVAPLGITKETGLEEVAAHYGVAREDIVAFGDMPNDIDMLAWAGWGVAMGQAPEHVAAAANEVTATNNEDGVAAVLERWF